MGNPAIVVEGISKRYVLGQARTQGDLLSERLLGVFRRRGRDVSPSTAQEEFWALQDVSLTVDRGAVIGLIGPNGAGKSTLLKLMARITTPSSGRITMRGRVGTLLEVGTGFHPELTGRENIFLNGSILGLSRREIAARLEEIVDFAGVPRFIDTPVKRYSSGMYVRLAFAVAAHLDPEILLVDEVLSVGDAEFQRKCIGTMKDAAAGGRTVVFVSHSMDSVRSLCSHAYLIEGGRIAAEGPSDVVVRRYLDAHQAPVHGGRAEIPTDTPRVGSGQARFLNVAVLGADESPVTALRLGEPMTLVATVEVFEPIPDAVVEFGLSTTDAIRIVTTHNIDEASEPAALQPGIYEIRAELDVVMLPGEYVVDLGVHRLATGATLDLVERVLRIATLPTGYNGADDFPFRKPRGAVRPKSTWITLSGSNVTPSIHN